MSNSSFSNPPMTDFTVYDQWVEVEKNTHLLEESGIDCVTFSIQKVGQKKAFLGRGAGWTGSAFVGRFRLTKPIRLMSIVVYFDENALTGWQSQQTFGIMIYAEDPDHGLGSPTHPPCTGASASTGSGYSIFPGGGLENFHQISRDEVFCFNQGLDPRNNQTEPLSKRAYALVNIGNIIAPVDSALSMRTQSTMISGWNNADITADLSFYNIYS